MEKIPNLKIIGNASEKDKKKAEDEMNSQLDDSRKSISAEVIDRLLRIEYPKSDSEIQAIEFANNYTNRLLKDSGLTPYDIDEKNFFIVPNDEYLNETDGGDSNAVSYPAKKIAVFNAHKIRNNPVAIASIILHETIHLKSALTLEVFQTDDKNKEGEPKVGDKVFRSGVSVKSANKHDQTKGLESHEHFKGLHEAIVSEIEKNALPELMKIPALAGEIKRLNSEKIKEKIKKIAEEGKIPEDEIYWVSDETEDFLRLSYSGVREVLEYLCREIYDQFHEKYSSPDGVLQEFVKAQCTGRILTIAKLIEETFGEGSFRNLGNMTSENDNATMHFESLRKARIRFKKNK